MVSSEMNAPQRGFIFRAIHNALFSGVCAFGYNCSVCRTWTHALVCVCVRLESPFSPLPQPASKFSFDALPAPRVPASDCRRVSCSLSSCPPAGSLAASAPGQVDRSPRARRCVLTAADTGAFTTEKFRETFFCFLKYALPDLGEKQCRPPRV